MPDAGHTSKVIGQYQPGGCVGDRMAGAEHMVIGAVSDAAMGAYVWVPNTEEMKEYLSSRHTENKGHLEEIKELIGSGLSAVQPVETPKDLQQLTPTLSRFGGARATSDGVQAGSPWASGYYSDPQQYGIKDAGEWVQFTPSGTGVYGLNATTDYSNSVTTSAAIYLIGDKFTAFTLNKFLKRDIDYAGEPVRITVIDDGVQWALVRDGLVIPVLEFPIKIPSLAAPWGVFGSASSTVGAVTVERFTPT